VASPAQTDERAQNRVGENDGAVGQKGRMQDPQR
jgi:hypothetical protein